MTNPQIIRLSEDRSRWNGMDRRLRLVSEERSRLPGRGDRLLLVVAYSFVLFALCLLLMDFCWLLFTPNLSTDLSRQNLHQTHQVRHVPKSG